MSTEKIDIPGLLSRMPLFGALSPEDLAHMAAATREKRLQKGERLFQRGEHPKGFFLVVWGQVKLAFTSAQGNEKVVEILGPLQSFGEAVMFLDQPYPVLGEALADTLLLHIGSAAVFGQIEQDPCFARKLLAGMSIRLHSTRCARPPSGSSATCCSLPAVRPAQRVAAMRSSCPPASR